MSVIWILKYVMFAIVVLFLLNQILPLSKHACSNIKHSDFCARKSVTWKMEAVNIYVIVVLSFLLLIIQFLNLCTSSINLMGYNLDAHTYTRGRKSLPFYKSRLSDLLFKSLCGKLGLHATSARWGAYPAFSSLRG